MKTEYKLNILHGSVQELFEFKMKKKLRKF